MTYRINNNFRESEFFTDLIDKLSEDEVRKNIDQWDILFPEDIEFTEFITDVERIDDTGSENEYTYRNTYEDDKGYVVNVSISAVVGEDNIVEEGDIKVSVLMGPLAGQGYSVMYYSDPPEYIEVDDDGFTSSAFVS